MLCGLAFSPEQNRKEVVGKYELRKKHYISNQIPYPYLGKNSITSKKLDFCWSISNKNMYCLW